MQLKDFEKVRVMIVKFGMGLSGDPVTLQFIEKIKEDGLTPNSVFTQCADAAQGGLDEH